MRQCARKILLLMACLVLAAGMTPLFARADAAWAKTGEANYYPEGDQAAFKEALAQDRLALVPVEISFQLDGKGVRAEIDRYFDALPGLDPALDTRQALLDKLSIGDSLTFSLADLYAAASYLSLSPDGRRLFAVYEGIPFVLDLNEQSLRLMAPDQAVPLAYVEKVFQTFIHRPQDGGVVWSPRGSHLALASTYEVLTFGRLGQNILLMDVEAGSFRLVDPELPPDLNMTDKVFETGFPFRAVFSQTEPVLYYEVYGILEGGERASEIRSLHLETGETATYARTEPMMTTSDPALWPAPEGLLQTVSSFRRDGVRGLALHPPKGDTLYVSLDQEAPEQRTIEQMLLPSFAGGAGVLYIYRDIRSGPPVETFQLFFMEKDEEGLFNSHLVLRPDRTPDQRLETVSLAGLTREAVITLYEDPGLMLPGNAVLSPDGRHLILTGNLADAPRMFILDIERGLAGEVQLAAAEVADADSFAPFEKLRYQLVEGITWADNNRLLVYHDGGYRLYELGILK